MVHNQKTRAYFFDINYAGRHAGWSSRSKVRSRLYRWQHTPRILMVAGNQALRGHRHWHHHQRRRHQQQQRRQQRQGVRSPLRAAPHHMGSATFCTLTSILQSPWNCRCTRCLSRGSVSGVPSPCSAASSAGWRDASSSAAAIPASALSTWNSNDSGQEVVGTEHSRPSLLLPPHAQALCSRSWCCGYESAAHLLGELLCQHTVRQQDATQLDNAQGWQHGSVDLCGAGETGRGVAVMCVCHITQPLLQNRE